MKQASTINLAIFKNSELVKSSTLMAVSAALVFGAISIKANAFDINEVPGEQMPLLAEFNSLDKNGNDTLNRAEVSKDKLYAVKANFSKADIDDDGTLDYDEYANYKSAIQQKKLGRAASDTLITAKAKAEILATDNLKTLQISVQTYKGDVILSGFVDNEAAKLKAAEVVSKVKGVKTVKNSLVIKG